MRSKLGAADAFIVALLVAVQVDLWWFKGPTGSAAWASAGLLGAALITASFAAGTAEAWRRIVGSIATLAVLAEYAAFAPFGALEVDHRRWLAFAAAAVACGLAWSAGAVIRRRASAASARARAADESAATEATQARAQLAGERYAAIEDLFQTAIVEVVASQQALVRNAYPDDILTRMRGAEDAIHAALADLERLLTGGAEPAEAGSGYVPAPRSSDTDALPAELTRH